MPNTIPAELRNSRGLRKLKNLYAEELRKLHGNENSPALTRLRADIQSIERELFVGKPSLAASVATSRK